MKRSQKVAAVFWITIFICVSINICTFFWTIICVFTWIRLSYCVWIFVFSSWAWELIVDTRWNGFCSQSGIWCTVRKGWRGNTRNEDRGLKKYLEIISSIVSNSEDQMSSQEVFTGDKKYSVNCSVNRSAEGWAHETKTRTRSIHFVATIGKNGITSLMHLNLKIDEGKTWKISNIVERIRILQFGKQNHLGILSIQSLNNVFI